jgi:hypothetical protein
MKLENNEILECDFAFKCPKKWENLAILDDPEKRFCSSCEREVFFITTRSELRIYRKLGRCVAANVYSPELGKGISIAGGLTPANVSTIHVLADQENADQVIVALNRLQRKQRREKTDHSKTDEEQA